MRELPARATNRMPEYRYRRNLPHWREDDVVYFVNLASLTQST
jgi:hypothetical protein